MNQPVRIVPIALSHAAGFHACLDAVARERKYLAQFHALPLEQVQGFVRGNIAADAAQFVALGDADAVVGWCDILPGWGHAVRHRGTLGIGVLASHRGQGVGQQLLRACIAKAHAKGMTRIELEARADNDRAIRLYERVGFVQEARKRKAMKFDGVDYDAVQMCLLLDQGEPVTRRLVSSGSSFEQQIGYSRAVVAGCWVFVSGTTGFDYATMTIATDVTQQAAQCLKNIETALDDAGAGLRDVVRVTYVLPDASDFERCWPVLRAAFGQIRPAATMIVAGLADPRMKIEIEVTALTR